MIFLSTRELKDVFELRQLKDASLKSHNIPIISQFLVELAMHDGH